MESPDRMHFVMRCSEIQRPPSQAVVVFGNLLLRSLLLASRKVDNLKFMVGFFARFRIFIRISNTNDIHVSTLAENMTADDVIVFSAWDVVILHACMFF